MAPNFSYGDAYTDERRAPGPRRDPLHKQGDRERPQASRRDSREFREPRSPYEQRREYEPPRPLHIDTRSKPQEGARKMPNNSPASAVDRLSSDLHFQKLNAASEKPIATNSAITDTLTSALPKAKNPDLQEAFENAYRWGEKYNKRLLLSIRKNKVAQENAQRESEKEKYQTKAAAYPPYHGLSHKTNAADQKLNDQLRAAEDDYLCELEQLVAQFTTATKPAAEPAADAQQNVAITALEAKVEQISQLATRQSEQIQKLLEEGSNSRDSITSLETDLSAVKSSHGDLEARYSVLETKYSALKSDHEALQKKIRSFDDTIRALQLRQASFDIENQNLKKQLRDLQSNTEEKLRLSDARFTELATQSSDIINSKELVESGLDVRITDIEAKLHDFDEAKAKLDELDAKTLDELQDAWVASEYNLKTLHEEYKERRGQTNSTIDETLRSLRQEVDSLRSSHSNLAQPGGGSTLSIQAVEEIVNARVAVAEQAINEDNRAYSEKKDDLYAEMISSIEARLDTLAPMASLCPRLETRIQVLELWKDVNTAWMDRARAAGLPERVDRLEGQRVGHRVDRIDLDVGDLSRKYEALKGEAVQLAKRDWVEIRVHEMLESSGVGSAKVNDIKDLQRKIPAIELAIKTLDSQFQNISTKQLAEHIVRLTNPSFEQRLGKLEFKANQLEVKTSVHDKSVNQHAEQLNLVTELLRLAVPGDKRTASPNQLDEPNKKRKLEANGRHPSPSQQQQQNNSNQHPA